MCDDDGSGGGNSGNHVDDNNDDDDDDDVPLATILAKKASDKAAKEALVKVKLEKLEGAHRAAGAIVLHTASVAEKVLKASGIKLHAGRKRASLSDFNHGAWKKGKEDAKSINLNQRAIGK